MAPPLGRQDSINSTEYNAKLRHGSPFVTWFEHTNSRRRPKTELNWDEDLFFFWSSPNFGPQTGLILGKDLIFLVFFGQEKRTDSGRKNFYSGLCYSQIF